MTEKGLFSEILQEKRSTNITNIYMMFLLLCVFNYFTRPAYLPGLEVESKFVALLDLHTCPVSLLLNFLYGIIGFGMKFKFIMVVSSESVSNLSIHCVRSA